MTGGRALALLTALAAIAIAGIVGMLLAEGKWDDLFFVMTAMPLLAGVGFALRASRRLPTSVR